jgi:hypothetical protein
MAAVVVETQLIRHPVERDLAAGHPAAESPDSRPGILIARTVLVSGNAVQPHNHIGHVSRPVGMPDLNERGPVRPHGNGQDGLCVQVVRVNRHWLLIGMARRHSDVLFCYTHQHPLPWSFNCPGNFTGA